MLQHLRNCCKIIITIIINANERELLHKTGAELYRQDVLPITNVKVDSVTPSTKINHH